MNIKPVKTHGMPAWNLHNSEIHLAVTVKGGQMAPVRFFADTDSPVEPYYISPWQNEAHPAPEPGVQDALRGDFLCMPFGSSEDSTENHPMHGEISESEWTLTGSSENHLELEISTTVRPGRVFKRIELKSGHSALYVSHRIDGFDGPVPMGHHAILPGDRVHHLSTTPLITGITDIAPPSPSLQEYYSAAPGEFFDDLSQVPTIWKTPAIADYSVFPLRDGFVDVLQVFPKAPGNGLPMWFCAAVPSHGYLWYSLKSPDILPSTVLWQENRGRYGAPWSGRNSCIGIEEVCSHLASGLKISTEENALTRRGLKTAVNPNGLTIRTIQGVCRIPDGFDRVSDVRFEDESVVFLSDSGQKAQTRADWKFVSG